MESSTISLEKLQEKYEKLQSENAYLREQLEWFKRQIFGQRSEKFVETTYADQLLLFDVPKEPLTEEDEPVPTKKRKKPKRDGKNAINLPDDLPVERQVVDLAEEDKICSETGKSLIKIGEDITQKIAHRPGSYFIKEIVRPKYASPNPTEKGVVSAPLPETLLDRCRADESLLTDILIKKFCDHLPLYRQSEILSRQGIEISRQVLSQWVLRCGKALKPLYDEMLKQILQSNNIFIDETPLSMLMPGNGKVHQAYMWVIVGGAEANPPYRFYTFRTNRRHEHVIDLLEDYRGVFHSDKYGAYEAFANRKQATWCPCYAHIRRKFYEAESGDPKLRKWVLRKVKYLIMLEKVAWKRSAEERLRIRQEKEVPIIDELIKVIQDKLINGKILPKSKLKEALGYFLGLVPHLKNYTSDPWSRLDNNVAERAVRPLAIGRKNWLFAGNEDGGEAAAVILTLVQSCRAVGVNPREYLEDVMKRLMSHNAQKLEELLPKQWAAARQQSNGTGDHA